VYLKKGLNLERLADSGDQWRNDFTFALLF